MFYVKEKFSFEDIFIGGRRVLNLDDRKIHFTCPGCGKKMKLWASQIAENCTPAEDDTSAYCPTCSEKRRAERSAEVEDDDYTTADMLIEELIDKARDTDGAQNFVYLRDMGVIVDIERCKDPGLLDAANTQLNAELAEAIAEIEKARGRITELENAQYRVVWNDHEGNEQEHRFNTLRDAIREEIALKEKFDYVQAFDPNGNEV